MASAEDIREVNLRYHDAAAVGYDAKWSIDFGPAGQRRIAEKLASALGAPPDRPFERALEVGAGTGYLSLNLLQSGAICEAVATDIAPGMLAALAARAEELGLTVATAPCEAAALPFPDDSFDLVLGHAVLHHLPDLEGAFAELRRVLRPGGTLAFCGEPSRRGHRLAAAPKRIGLAAAPCWRRLLGVPSRVPAPGHGGSAGEQERLESLVDVHSFDPEELEGLCRRAGFESVRVGGEELVANWFGWIVRTLEGSAPAGGLPRPWYLFALRVYLGLERLDRRLLEPVLPPSIFYNLLLSARAPEADGSAAAAGAHRSEARSAAAL